MNNGNSTKYIRYYSVVDGSSKGVLTSVFETESSYAEKYLETVEGRAELNALLSTLYEDGFESLVEDFDGYEKHTPLKRKRRVISET